MLFFAIGCPSCQIFECIYSSFHIQSNIHIVSNLFMCMLHQTVQVNTYVAFVLMTLIMRTVRKSFSLYATKIEGGRELVY